MQGINGFRVLALCAVAFNAATAGSTVGANQPAVGCDRDNSANFSEAYLTPDASAVRLLQRLGGTTDLAKGTARLSNRLFALHDDIRLAGQVRKEPGCFTSYPPPADGDGGLWFVLRLGNADRTHLLQFFANREEAVPSSLEVEFVKDIPLYIDSQPFRSWNAPDRFRILFRLPGELQRPLDAEKDWKRILSASEVRVRGALVVDVENHRVGTGHLEIHPAEEITIVR